MNIDKGDVFIFNKDYVYNTFFKILISNYNTIFDTENIFDFYYVGFLKKDEKLTYIESTTKHSDVVRYVFKGDKTINEYIIITEKELINNKIIICPKYKRLKNLNILIYGY